MAKAYGGAGKEEPIPVPKITGDDEILFIIKAGEISSFDILKPGHPVYDHVSSLYPYDESKMLESYLKINPHYNMSVEQEKKYCIEKCIAQYTDRLKSIACGVNVIGKKHMYSISYSNHSQSMGYVSCMLIIQIRTYININNWNEQMQTIVLSPKCFQFPIDVITVRTIFKTTCPTCNKIVNVYTREPSYMKIFGGVEIDYVECPDGHYKYKLYTYDEYLEHLKIGETVIPSVPLPVPSVPLLDTADLIRKIKDELRDEIREEFKNELDRMKKIINLAGITGKVDNTNMEATHGWLWKDTGGCARLDI